MEEAIIGLDIAKQVFQVHGINEAGAIVCRRRLRRDDAAEFFKVLPPCLIGIEAGATGHHWARVLTALGHEVRLMPASYVKPYVKRQKNGCDGCRGDLRGGDAADDALRSGEERGATECADAASGPRAFDPAANNAGERLARPLGRVRHRDATGHCRRRNANCVGRRR
ncbi:IS1111A/IS1328/IS1533 insertion sequence transposase (plasmid) [Rhizobium grahamii CCGE 502]|uniref:IS1111A/IS1328/IS1533 insertion sequence transposase n=1 Tax=Rhizobium grahamii CCGE 502 TaxID=990285 RepID=S3H5G8_9HYPH|nr:IS1111A/IS1328/IS1533 insertion sequence transposase [Rhizobium grahamii CCGE 502]EPE93989.1 IS1111A/IS1328/IS1533 insertion sequence transposase [Rhizobium grahamii CCGE 502]